ncbi:hypothetical protein BAY61_18225 [Prauserella marina]|nr:hypothetical protein BAY61_18225 [Prauserella marina]
MRPDANLDTEEFTVPLADQQCALIAEAMLDEDWQKAEVLFWAGWRPIAEFSADAYSVEERHWVDEIRALRCLADIDLDAARSRLDLGVRAEAALLLHRDDRAARAALGRLGSHLVQHGKAILALAAQGLNR